MKLIVGLGNPGEKYSLTRHNIGANVAKELAAINNISLRRRRYLSRFGAAKIGGEEVSIILPLTYMNLSGKAVCSIVKDKKIALSDILVICDDAEITRARLLMVRALKTVINNALGLLGVEAPEQM